MKKLVLLFAVCLMMVSFCGCSTSAENGTPDNMPETTVSNDGTNGSILVAYFSRAGENYNVGTVSEGNTAKLAREIAVQTGGDLFEIVPETAYPVSYEEMLDVATKERTNDERPAIQSTIENFDSYDTIFIGYPIWWGDLPMILHSFMESYDFTGKTVIPFNTHEGSGQAGTQSTIADKLSGAEVLQGLAMKGSTAQELSCDGTDATVKSWLDDLGIGKQTAGTGEFDLNRGTVMLSRAQKHKQMPLMISLKEITRMALPLLRKR